MEKQDFDFEYPILNIYETKRVITDDKRSEFAVHRLIESSKTGLQVAKKKFNLKMLVLAIILILFTLLTIGILAFGISSIKSNFFK